MGSPGSGPAVALLAALLFGLGAPAAKILVGSVDPWLLAGLLYLGSGIGLVVYRGLRRAVAAGTQEADVRWSDAPWLVGAIVAGGIVGPVLLMFALALGSAAQSSLLLNLEGVFTALLAWLVFREHVHGRIAAGMAAITAGALTLSWDPAAPALFDRSALLVAGACMAWAIDNNLTRRVSHGDPVQVAALKGCAAGGVNLAIALARGAALPPLTVALTAAVVGLLGYGISLVLFVLALRHLGTARTSAYFSTAPFAGTLGAAVMLGEPVTVQLLLAAVMMAIGVWLHLIERHAHEHVHEALEHDHRHRHDEHHRHVHPAGAGSDEPHAHRHTHAPLRHTHPHYPDLHHRHGH